jgi:hypothetical protein
MYIYPFSPDCQCYMTTAQNDYDNRDAIFAYMRSIGLNTIRIPLTSEAYNLDPYHMGGKAAQLQWLQNVVTSANAHGLYVDFGWWDSMSWQTAWPSNYTQEFPMFADVYHQFAGNPMVFYEPYNEPNSVSWSTWRAVMIDTVRYWRQNLGYRGVLFIDGLNWAFDLSVPDGAAVISYDVSANGGHANIVLANHRYANANTCFCGAELQDWESTWGQYVGQYPIAGTEYGYYNAQGPPQPLWNTQFLSYLAGTKVAQGFNGYIDFVWDWNDANSMVTAMGSGTGASLVILNQHGHIAVQYFYSHLF